MNYLIPLGIALLGVIALTIYVLAACLRDVTSQIATMSEKLMIMLGTRDGGPEVGRALVASSRKPKKDIPGVVEPKKEEPKGYSVTVGAR